MSANGFLNLIRVFWTLGDRLAPLFEKLPDQLPNAGRAMVNGGDVAITTSQVLVGGGGVPINAQQVVNEMEIALSRCYQELRQVRDSIQGASNTIAGIQVPTVSAHMDRIMGHDLCTGLDFSSTSLFGGFSSDLNNAISKLDPALGSLDTAASKLTDLSNALGLAGTDLNTLGTAFKDAGNALQNID
jgi:hypothetical protein